MMVRTQWQIGSWTFDADGGRLLAGSAEVPLEHRAARTLDLLCRNRGRAVSREAILAEVWQGRSVSANSVAVVIADLRRALGDDPAAPRLIATVPKRGYRLNDEALPAAEPVRAVPVASHRSRRLAVVLAVFVLLASAFLVARRQFGVDRIAVVVSPTTNDTGQARFRPLATALQALVTDRLAEMGVDVIASDTAPVPRSGQRTLRLRSRLILWNGLSTLSMEAVDDAGHVTWTAMAMAPPDGLASATVAQLKTFKAAARGR